jgi:hypothetical protein
MRTARQLCGTHTNVLGFFLQDSGRRRNDSGISRGAEGVPIKVIDPPGNIETILEGYLLAKKNRGHAEGNFEYVQQRGQVICFSINTSGNGIRFIVLFISLVLKSRIQKVQAGIVIPL